MLTRTFGRILTALSLAFLSACTTVPEEKAGEWLSIEVQAHNPETKLTLTDTGTETQLGFSEGDAMGFFANGFLKNIKLTCTSAEGGSFSGKALASSEDSAGMLDYYAYYPYCVKAGEDPSALTATLPSKQKAPFDDQADFMVADPITDRYDVEDFPALTFEFSTHLFAVVKLNVTNTNEAYADEQILSIGLKSTSAPLAGQFTFSAVDGDMDFTDDPNYLSNQVLVEYETPPTLGTGVTHSVYAVVNAASYASGSLSLVVNTTNYIFTKTSRKVLRPKTYQMTALGTVDVASASRRKRVRTLMLWGDSITSEAYAVQVQEQLGPNWIVTRGGVPGDTAPSIAARQGGIAMVTGESSFVLPASASESVSIDNLYAQEEWQGETIYRAIVHNWTFRGAPQLNPLVINGIACEVSYVDDTKEKLLRRLEDGEAVEIPARSVVSTYGARSFADVDVIVVYMGTNNRPKNDRLINLHDMMRAHLTNPDAIMIVSGFHESAIEAPNLWTPAYVEAFTDHYGDYFIDQRTLGGGANAIPLMKEIGQITDESQISETDRMYIERGDWPLSWFFGENDVHPNYTLGVKVQAILLRRRMAELGLL